MKHNVCNAISCRALVLPTQVFCERHDRMLQSDVRTILGRQFRPGRRQSLIFERTLERARNEILYAQTSGHRIPRDAEFQW